MRICYDLDDTLCHGYPYDIAKPLPGAAEHLARMRSLGYTVIINTARGMGRTNGNVGAAMAAVSQSRSSLEKEVAS